MVKNGDEDCRPRGGAAASLAGQEATVEWTSCDRATEVAVAICIERRPRSWGPSLAVLAVAKSAWTQMQSLPDEQEHRLNEMPRPTPLQGSRETILFEYESKPI